MRITYDGHDYIFNNGELRCANTGQYQGIVYRDITKEYWHYDDMENCSGSIHVNEGNALDNAIKSLIVVLNENHS